MSKLLVDIRRYPGSRAHPQLARDALAAWLPRHGVAHRWEERLGGRRHPAAGAHSPDTWWTVPAFRAYAGYTRPPSFLEALPGLLAEAGQRRLAVMCSESVGGAATATWFPTSQCSRTPLEVHHLMPGGRLRPHQVAAGARRREDGLLVWDGDPILHPGRGSG